MYKLGKRVPSGKEILSNINLSFYPGAKIGVLGNNGAGKSTLMRIMAGVDPNYEGDAAPAKWAKIGYLEQEPKLDDEKTVRENIEVAVASTRSLITRCCVVLATPCGQGARVCFAQHVVCSRISRSE